MNAALQNLKAAREILSDPGAWTKQVSVQRVEGRVCYCALGALRAGAGLPITHPIYFWKSSDPDKVIPGLVELVESVRELHPDHGAYYREGCAAEACGLIEPHIGYPITRFNDYPSTTHAEVLAVFDHAIDKLTPKLLDVLVKARELIVAGWIKGDMAQAGCYCAAGAVNAVGGEYSSSKLYGLSDDMQPTGMREIAEALETLFPDRNAWKVLEVRVNLSGRVWRVNDAIETTKEDVIRAFDYAIKKEENRIAADKLAQVRSLIETKEGWVRGKYKDCRPDGTLCYCILGAVAEVHGYDYGEGSYPTNLSSDKLVKLLASTVTEVTGAEGDPMSQVYAFNDDSTNTHADVLNLIDRTIEKLRAPIPT